MDTFLSVLSFAVPSVFCVWISLFILSWREAYAAAWRTGRTEEPEPVAMPWPRGFSQWAIVPLYWAIGFLVWPVFVGGRIGRARAKRLPPLK